MREETFSLVRINFGAVLIGGKKVMLENPIAVKPKHATAQAAMLAQSSMDFCVLLLGTLWWWSQSVIVSVATTSMALLPAAKPTAAGSVATDRARTATKMIRPRCMVMLFFINDKARRAERKATKPQSQITAVSYRYVNGPANRNVH